MTWVDDQTDARKGASHAAASLIALRRTAASASASRVEPLRYAAIHEAGHVVMRAWEGLPPAAVRIDGAGGGFAVGSGGVVRTEGLMRVALAGRIAESIFAGRERAFDFAECARESAEDPDAYPCGHDADDEYAAWQYAQTYCRGWGDPVTTLDRAADWVREVLTNEWPRVVKLADALEARRHLTASDVRALLD